MTAKTTAKEVRADVAVIGGGPAGAMAAVAAATAGAEVILVAGPPGATAFSSGAVDLLCGPSPSVTGLEDRAPALPSLADRLLELASFFPRHPLVELGEEQVTRLGDMAKSLLTVGPGRLYAPTDRSRALTVSPLGAIRATFLAQVCQVDLLSLGKGPIGICDCGRAGTFSPWLCAGRLESQLATDAQACPVETVPVEVSKTLDLAHPLAAAKALDGDEELLSLLCRSVEKAAKGTSSALAALLIPAFAGIRRPREICAALSEAAGTPVLELLGSPGEPAGLRLHLYLEGLAADRCGSDQVIGGRAMEARIEGSRLQAVVVSRASGAEGEVCVGAETFVMATGGLVGGGLELDKSLTEPLLDLPVEVAGVVSDELESACGLDPTMLFSAHPTAPHPVLSGGVAVDRQLRPLRRQDPVFDNVHVAGALLAGHDPAIDGTGMGTALVTGLRAGELAARAG